VDIIAGEIRNKIVLEDGMSATLEAINAKVKAVYSTSKELQSVFLKFPNLINETSASVGKFKESFGGIEEQVGKIAGAFDTTGSSIETAIDMAEKLRERTYSVKIASDYLKESQEALRELNIDIGEISEDIKETIAAKVEIIHEKAEAIEEVNESLERTKQKTTNNTRGMNQMAQSIARLGSNLGVIPKQVSMIVSGVIQLNSGLSATKFSLVTISKLIAPITLVATSVMAILSILRHFRQDTDEVVESFDGLIRSANSLTRESESLSRKLEENIALMERMAGLGASDALLDNLKAQNEELEEHARLLNIIAARQQQRAVEDIIETLTGQELIGIGSYMSDRLSDMTEEALERHRRELEFHGVVGANIYSDSFIETLQQNLDDWEGLTELELLDLGESVQGLYEYMDALRDGGEEAEDLIRIIANMVNQFNNLPVNINRATNAISEQAKELYYLEAAYRRANAVMAAQEQMARRITRSFRNTYDAANTMAQAHNTVASALEGMNSGYGVTIEQFDAIMSIAPEHLNFLFDEHGALLDVEDALEHTIQAYMELETIRQVNAFLDSVGVWDEETGALISLTSTVDDATEAMREFKNARLSALAASVAAGGEYAEDAARALAIAEQIIGFGVSARERAGRDPMGLVGSARGTRSNPVVVQDIETEGFRGEMVQLWRDINEVRYVRGTYQQGGMSMPPITVNSPVQVYAADNMSANKVVDLIYQHAGHVAAKEFDQCFKSTLRRYG